MCLFQVNGNAEVVIRRGAGPLAVPAVGVGARGEPNVLFRKPLALVSRWVLWVRVPSTRGSPVNPSYRVRTPGAGVS